MALLNHEVNRSFDGEVSVKSEKRAAILIQRTVRHWLKKWEAESVEDYGDQLPEIQICDL
jgi:hypothetical protein